MCGCSGSNWAQAKQIEPTVLADAEEAKSSPVGGSQYGFNVANLFGVG